MTFSWTTKSGTGTYQLLKIPDIYPEDEFALAYVIPMTRRGRDGNECYNFHINVDDPDSTVPINGANPKNLKTLGDKDRFRDAIDFVTAYAESLGHTVTTYRPRDYYW
jgi:hypothetical protein